MNRTITHIAKFGLVLLLLTGLLPMRTAMASSGDISDTDKYAWSENAGWINFNPSYGGVTVNDTYLSGYAWAENSGYIKLGNDNGGPYNNTSSTDWGVNQDGSGNLSGYAWSDNAGWINFNPTHSQVTIDTTTGSFDGYAWAENDGWIHFKNSSPTYNVTVVFTDTTPPTVPTVTGITPTTDTTPTWSWTAGGGGNGTFRYKLDDSDLTSGATETTSTSYTPASALSEGIRTLYVQERDAVGNWSSSGSKTIIVDTTAPSTTVSVRVGTYASARSITLTCTDNSGGSGCDKTYYTTDGSTPTTSSSQYSSTPIIVSTSTTLKFFSTDNAGNTERVKLSEYFIVPTGTPTLSVSPASLDFGSSTSTMNLNISNTGGGQMSWSITSDKSWLTINSPSGLTESATDRREVKVNRSGLSAGNYTGTITVNAGDAGTTAISVTMTVSGSPVLDYAPSQIDFGHLRTQASLYITNIGINTLNWTVSTTSSWLSFDISLGDTTTEKDTVTMTIDRSGMSIGENTGTVDLSDGTNTINIPVTVYKPDSGVTVTSMTTNPSNIDADGTTPSTVTVEFTNCANQSVTFFTNLGYFSGSSSTTVTSDSAGIAAATYTASLVAGIATIKAVCNGVTAASTINLNTISFTNAETEILDTGAGSIDKKLTTGISMEKDGFGTPSATLAVYSSNPGETAAFNLISTFFDAHLDNTEDINTVTIKRWVTADDIVGTDTNDLVLYYADGITWKRCSDTGFIADTSDASYVGYIYATFTENSTPSIEYLDGLPLAGGIISGMITGIVSSATDNSPIEGAIISSDLGGCDISQANGAYVFNTPAGTVTVSSSCTIPNSCTITNATPCSGYFDASVSGVSVSSGGAAGVNIPMSPVDTTTVDFSSSIYTAKPNSGAITITVNLSIVSVNTITVDYATSDGTATGGSDYTAVSGTLTFSAGVTSKTFTVTPINGGVSGGTVTLTLSKPSNVILGTKNNSAILITNFIPTLSEWGMVAMVILLLISGIFIMVNNRKRAV